MMAFMMTACPCVCYWPCLLSYDYWLGGSWVITCVLAPLCAGVLGSLWCFGLWVNTAGTKLLFDDDDEGNTAFAVGE